MATYDGDFEKLKQAFLDFIHRMPFYGTAVVCIDDPAVRSLLPALGRPTVTYGFSDDADVRAEGLVQREGKAHFQVHRPGQAPLPVALAIPGRHNVLNALAAIAVATEEGVSDIAIRKALDSFAGVGRRFEQHARRIGGHAVLQIDDYGHHPTEVEKVLETARETFPGRRRVMIYQPHRYTRTRDLFDAFVRVLSEPDLLILLEVYSAGEAPIPGADAAALAAALRQRGGVLPVVVTGVDEVPALLPTLLRDGDVVLTQGAGDIGRLTRLLAEEGTHG
jgi:UDP-N-acetylmuramate--alanine ligase